uniref:C2H2-type domain-containing protein n=1 Tax=Hippocampus comes TaxID=109280 RepID=A0A3Q3D8F4_HIPCM
MNTRQPHGYLVRTPKFLDTMHCGKCGFATSDVDLFKRHMLDHTGSKLFCIYCQKSVLNKAELNSHLEEHIKSTLSCPHCGQRYMRKMNLLKHIEYVHSKNISQALKKVGGINVPALSTPSVSLVKDGQQGRTMNTMLPISSKVVPDSVVHHNRALTVSLPEEISIPAGCLVELVEVKTVNGSKELKLRLVSQQENEAGMKDTRTTVQQNLTAGKTLACKLNPPNAVKSPNMGMCVVNRKLLETKMAAQQCSAVKPVSASKSLMSNQASKVKLTLKRTSQEVINLDSPTKVSKTVCNPVRERNEIVSTWSELVHDRAKANNVLLTRETRMLTSHLQSVIMGSSAYQQITDQSLKSIPDQCKSIHPSKADKAGRSVLDRLTTVKSEPGMDYLKDNTGSKVKDTPKVMNTPAGVNQQGHKPTSLNVTSGAAVRVTPSKVNLCQESDTPHLSFPSTATGQRTVHASPSLKMPTVPCRSKSDIPVWPQVARPSKETSERDTPKPEGFPVISSVFSLSEQQGNTEGAMQPLVMALRGIVMDKSSTTEKVTPNVNRMCGSVKEESKIELIQQQPSNTVANVDKDDVMVEKTRSTQTDNCSHDPALKSENAEPVSANVSDVSAFDVNRQYDISKFLTVSLTRVDERGMCMNSEKGPKPPARQCDTPIPVRDAGRLMPLKVEQLVTWPCPNQPVVVLNHPKPRVPIQEPVNAVANTGIPEKAPKCQILKMRLCKVIGQKYEVTGCTVRFFQ